MTKVLVLYYSAYGHIETMANAVAEGARSTGATVDIKRVPELVPPDVAKASYYKVDQAAPIAEIDDLANYDAIIVGTGTRFGRMASQMANFLDQAGGLWAKGALHGKVGGAFTSTATQHGGQETTLFSIVTNLLHFGMTIVGLNYGFAGQMKLDEVTGGSPYGSTTITGGDGSRQPSANELEGAALPGARDRRNRQKSCMADAMWAAFSAENAALSAVGTMGFAMIEMLFIYQLASNPLQAMARRWWCRSLFRASRGRCRCPECTKS